MGFTSCQMHDDDIVQQVPEKPTPVKVNQLSYQEALSKALDAVASIEGVTTKSSSRKVKNYEVVKTKNKSTTKSITSDTLFYLFNFEDDKGFAMISSDPRIGGALAMSTTGSFDINSANESGASLFLSGIENYQTEAIDDMNNGHINLPNVSDIVGGDGGMSRPPRCEYGPGKMITMVEPMLGELRWGQKSTYNEYIPFRDAAGCVTIAIAQIMAYFRYPTSHDGFTYNWDEMTGPDTGNSHSTKRFISDVFYHLPFKDPGSESTGIPDRSVVYCLDDMGYRDDGQEHDYDWARVVNSIDGGSPVYISGDKEKYAISGGHAWVIDGYAVQSQMRYIYRFPDEIVLYPPLDVTPSDSTICYYDYVHCNWGWADPDTKSCDGYYHSAVLKAVPFPSLLKSPTKNTEEKYYQYNLKVRVNIKP